MLYVDTGILVAALTREPATGRMQAWLADQAAGMLAISEWVLAVFTALVEASFQVLPVSGQDFRAAARLADQHATGLRAGDALHLAVASRHGARVRTLERGLAAAAEALGVSVARV
jgi:predicted nucleic acid-binding protein